MFRQKIPKIIDNVDIVDVVDMADIADITYLEQNKNTELGDLTFRAYFHPQEGIFVQMDGQSGDKEII